MSKKEYCLDRLRQCAAELDRLPKKSDMSRMDVMLVKSCLGPWPRALEKAGLKPVSARKIRRNRRAYTPRRDVAAHPHAPAQPQSKKE